MCRGMDRSIKGPMVIWPSIKLRIVFHSCFTPVSIHYIRTVPIWRKVLRALWCYSGRADRLFNISVRLQPDWWLTGAAMQGALPRLAETSTSIPFNLNVLLLRPEKGTRGFFCLVFGLGKSSHNASNIIQILKKSTVDGGHKIILMIIFWVAKWVLTAPWRVHPLEWSCCYVRQTAIDP